MSPFRSSQMAALALVIAAAASGQQPQPQRADSVPPTPAMGDVAPDFSFRPISRDGIARAPKKLSDYRGQTVVLWFFIKARTRG